MHIHIWSEYNEEWVTRTFYSIPKYNVTTFSYSEFTRTCLVCGKIQNKKDSLEYKIKWKVIRKIKYYVTYPYYAFKSLLHRWVCDCDEEN